VTACLIPRSLEPSCRVSPTSGPVRGESPLKAEEIVEDGLSDFCASIWLEDVSDTLSNSSPTTQEYTGFDISTKHFPRAQKPGMDFHEHDILQPFPADFHNRYDLVHIRLLVLALRKDQFEAAVTNVAALLKQGGYIQWEEFETKNMAFNPPSDITTQVRAIIRKSAQANGLTNTPCADISQYLNTLGPEDVRIVDYDSSSREDLAPEAREWTKAGAKAALYYALLRDGAERSPEETRALADDLLAKYVYRIDEGVVPTMPLARVVGRKQ